MWVEGLGQIREGWSVCRHTIGVLREHTLSSELQIGCVSVRCPVVGRGGMQLGAVCVV